MKERQRCVGCQRVRGRGVFLEVWCFQCDISGIKYKVQLPQLLSWNSHLVSFLTHWCVTCIGTCVWFAGFVFFCEPLHPQFSSDDQAKAPWFQQGWAVSLAVGAAAPPSPSFCGGSLEVPPPLACWRACPQVFERLRLMPCTGLKLCRDWAAHFGNLCLKMFAKYVWSTLWLRQAPKRVLQPHAAVFCVSPLPPTPLVCSSWAEGFEDKALLLYNPDSSPRQLHVVSWMTC